MSALFGYNYELNLFEEYGIDTRSFNKNIRVKTSSDYQSVLFLLLECEKKIPNFMPDYRNHCTLYANYTDKSILICRSETTRILTDIDAFIEYTHITPIISRNNHCGDWSISFDKISYSNKKPDSFSEFTCICEGEWWYFDKGVCIVGTKTFNPNLMPNTNKYCFIYYELHPKYKDLLKKKQCIWPPAIRKQPILRIPSITEKKDETKNEPNVDSEFDKYFNDVVEGKVTALDKAKMSKFSVLRIKALTLAFYSRTVDPNETEHDFNIIDYSAFYADNALYNIAVKYYKTIYMSLKDINCIEICKGTRVSKFCITNRRNLINELLINPKQKNDLECLILAYIKKAGLYYDEFSDFLPIDEYIKNKKGDYAIELQMLNIPKTQDLYYLMDELFKYRLGLEFVDLAINIVALSNLNTKLGVIKKIQQIIGIVLKSYII